MHVSALISRAVKLFICLGSGIVVFAFVINSLSRLHWQRLLATKCPKHQSAWLSCLGVDAWEVLSPESTTEGSLETEVIAYEDLEQFATRRNLLVDSEFQEPSANLCKRRWRTFWALIV